MTTGSRLYRIRKSGRAWDLYGLVAFGHYMYLAGGFLRQGDAITWLDTYRRTAQTTGWYITVHSE